MQGESPLGMMRRAQRRPRKPSAGRAGRRRWPFFAALAAVSAIAWGWLWYYAAAIADRTLAGWVEREAAAGRVYSCAQQSIGGFPLSIKAHCADASAAITSTQPRYAAKAKAVTFTAEVYHPTRLIGDIVGPLTLAQESGLPSFVADWTQARISVRGVPPYPESVSFDLTGPRLDVTGPPGATIFSAERAELRSRLAGGSPRDHPVIEVVLRLGSAVAPTLHPFLAAPIDLDLDATLRGMSDLSPKPWVARWREIQAAGGEIEIQSMRIAQTGVIAVGAGTLKLNSRGKLDGVLRVAIVGLEHLVPVLGVDRLVAEGVNRLSGVEGSAAQGADALNRLLPGLSDAIRDSANASVVDNLKKMGQPSAIDKQPAIVLPLRLVDSSIYLGMLRVGELPPLF